jgi:hypothetical protein
LIYSATTELPLRIMTLLLPDSSDLMTPPAVRVVYDSDGLPDGLVFEHSGESVMLEGGTSLHGGPEGPHYT